MNWLNLPVSTMREHHKENNIFRGRRGSTAGYMLRNVLAQELRMRGPRRGDIGAIPSNLREDTTIESIMQKALK